MSVPNQTPYNIYTANGLTTVFTYEFYIISASDLQVSINGDVVTSGYTVAGVGNKDGGDITFLTPPANGAVVMLERVVPTYRLTDYQDNGDLLADTVNKDFDRIWMAIQRAFIDLGFALTRPFFGGPFDAKGYRISNLGEPVQKQDAATKRYVDASISGSNSYADTLFKRTLRVPEQGVNQLRPVSGRRNSLLGFDSNGDPVPIFSMTDTADLAIKLASHEKGLGASLVGLENRGTVQDALPDVYLPSYGVVIQPASMIAGTTAIGDIPAVDMTDKLIEAINDAKRLGVGLDTGIRSIFGPAPSGYVYATKSVDFTGLKHVKGFLPLGVIPETFVPTLLTAENPPRGMLMRNMNARYDSEGKQYAYSTAVGPEFDGIGVYGLRDMPENIIGMVHTAAYSHFNGPVWARRFATGIYLANTYDISIAAQWAVVDCGSKNYPPLMVGSYPAADVPDESNSITFPRLLLHSNKYRDAEIVGSKINITAIHAEDCTVGSLEGMTPRGFDQFAPNGIASLVIATTGGKVGNINYSINRNSKNNGCLLVNMLGTQVSQIYADRNIIDVKISDVYHIGSSGSIGSIKTEGNLYTDGGSEFVIGAAVVGGDFYNGCVHSHTTRATVTGNVDNSGTIERLECKGSLTQSQYGKVNGGSIGGNVTMVSSSKLTDVTINGDFISSAVKPTLTHVTVNGQWRVTGGGEFIDCTMQGFGVQSVNFVPNYKECTFTSSVTAPTANARAIFNACRSAPYNFDDAVNPDFRIYNGSASGLSMDRVTTGSIIVDGLILTAGQAIKGWSRPVSFVAGYGAKTINPYTGAGWMMLDNNGAAAWLPIRLYQ
ncbi:phage tail fiber protein [Klebsiella aerogenes]|uniref:phage tail fiber domain-containing protein n=1 Tax=Klebsiella aerogenes TaxID=548 RepID=UPI002DB94632|nr:phage tail fiber protein [Klebsiella aerogenes]MEB6076086.1 phage tail fiber protein [Klebsiella aerogenes]